MNKLISNLNLIGKGMTKIYSSDKNRMINLEIASDKINNYILKPNEEFSFNKILGKRTEENGYKLAESIDNGKIVKTIGGGICQISSTLNIAVKMANLKILEVHKHSKTVEYITPNYEAAVAYPSLDYRFINNRLNNIVIKSKVDKKSMKVDVYIYEEK